MSAPDLNLRAAAEVIARARDLGFALAGIAPAQASDHAEHYRRWIESGQHGEMAYLARHIELRLNPSELLPGALSIIMVADLYATRDEPHAATQSPTDDPRSPSPTPLGRIARYAQGDDYHFVMKKRLHDLADELRAANPGHEFRAFVDTAPVLEREHAARAGLGWIGKHTLLIHPRLGSRLFLGGIITTLPLAPHANPITDHCGTCTRCIDACPTSAITPYSVNASRCISYLTIEHRSEIPAELHAPIGEWLFGCDICQDVCPHNSPRPEGAEVGTPSPEYAPRHAAFDLLGVLGWSEDDHRAAFARSALKRAKLDMIQRNARINRQNLA